MKKELKISLAEFDMVWENPTANREILDKILKDIETDLIILPEMFSTGFTMNPTENAEPSFGETYKWMSAISEKNNVAVCGSISTAENDKYVNRLYFVTPEETFIYDKKHLFGYGKETTVYTPGNRIETAYYKGWKFRLSICYDLRFPAWLRNTDEYDVLLCPASWPVARDLQWQTLLRARAIENMAYVIGVNRTGTDGYDLDYVGNSKVFDAVGLDIPLNKSETGLLQTTITKESIKNYRTQYRFLNDRDDFKLD